MLIVNFKTNTKYCRNPIRYRNTKKYITRWNSGASFSGVMEFLPKFFARSSKVQSLNHPTPLSVLMENVLTNI